LKTHRKWRVLGLFLIIGAAAALDAQEPGTQGLIPAPRNQAVVLDIDARVVETNQTVVWKEAHQRLTIPGRAVGMNLVGANLAVAVQFTPYLRSKGQHMLVAQVQMWVEDPKQGIRYQTSLQTIPLDFDEPVYFFPLGTVSANSAHIEIKIILKHHKDPAAPTGPGTPANATGNSR
jgi:hypothetical protein